MLTEYLGEHGIRFPEDPKILNIGCGNNVQWNFLAVTGYLLDLGLGPPHYVGVDLREEAFAQAKEHLAGLVHFVAADARQLSRHVEGPFHLIVVEHPNLSTSAEGPRIWRQVFEEAASLLAQDGALILTSFWLNDHIPAQVNIERAGYRLLFSGTNRYPGRTFDTLATGESLQADKYILIAAKREPL
jgi:SAM-dependent methyltransferase